MTEAVKQEIRDLPADKDWYICTQCSGLGTAMRQSFKNTVLARDGFCLDCIEKKNKAATKRSFERKKLK